MRRKTRRTKSNRNRTKLGLPDLEHFKSAVLVSLHSNWWNSNQQMVSKIKGVETSDGECEGSLLLLSRYYSRLWVLPLSLCTLQVIEFLCRFTSSHPIRHCLLPTIFHA